MAKQQAKQRVKIRQDKTAENRTALFLDWSINNKRYREYIKLFIFEKPQTVFERQHNKEILAKAEILRNLREIQYYSDTIDEIIENKTAKNQDFTAYFEKYVKEYKQKDLRVMNAVLGQFKAFAPPLITAKEITEEFCLKFKEYLNENLKGESPASYFARFKKVLQYATKHGKMFAFNPAYDVKNKRQDASIQKDILTIEEIQALAKTQCGNNDVKQAFLFCCNTGLRFGDVKAMTWNDVKDNETIEIEQDKTKDKAKDGGKLIIRLNATAKALLNQVEKKETDLVFKLPSHNATIKNLKNWTKKAGIEKHITFHCSRHTFGTLLSYYGNDINMIASLLGHTSYKHTAKYVRTAEEMRQKAVETIPTINI